MGTMMPVPPPKPPSKRVTIEPCSAPFWPPGSYYPRFEEREVKPPKGEPMTSKPNARTICNECEHVRRSFLNHCWTCGSACAQARNDKTDVVTGAVWCKDVNHGACEWFARRQARPTPQPKPRRTLFRWLGRRAGRLGKGANAKG